MTGLQTKAGDARRGFPVYLTRFVGREREIARAVEVLGGARLLTLTGPGGIGKTRLGVEVAATWTDGHPADAWFVDLSTVSEGEGVVGEVARTLGVPDGPGELVSRMAGFLNQGGALLVLDNCEQVVEAAAELAAALLARSAVVIVATSREPLGVAGEVLQEVPPLDTEAAVELLAERSRAMAPGRNVAVGTELARRICQRLDGMPLAIELAAARTRALSLAEIDARLDDRLALLAGGPRSLPERQRTLAGALDWSYQLLTDKERTLYARLSVFAGGWTLAAVEEVCSGDGIEREEVLDSLAALVDRSLVTVEASGEPTRYRMLETIREHAGARLEDRERWRARHFEWVLQAAEVEAEVVKRQGSPAESDGLEPDWANVRLALDWSSGQTGMAREALRLATAAATAYWLAEPKRDAVRRLQQLIDRAGDEDPRLLVESLLAAGQMLWRLGELPAVRELLERARGAVAVLDDPQLDAWVELRIGTLVSLQGEKDEAMRLLDQCERVFQEQASDYGLANVIVYRHFVSEELGAALPAEVVADQLERVRAAGDRELLSVFLISLGEEARMRGDLATARLRYEEALRIRMELIPDALEAGGGIVDLNLSLTAAMEGATREAAERLLRISARLETEPNSYIAAGLLLGGALVLALEGELADAARLIGACEAVERAVQTRRNVPDQAVFEAARDRCVAGLGERGYEDAYQAGARLSEHSGIDQTERLLKQFLERTEPAARPAKSRPGGLSGQEAEVLRLVAMGRTNREIASELTLSVRTVENHIFNAYSKIRVRGRAEATAWAIGQGLVEAGRSLA